MHHVFEANIERTGAHERENRKMEISRPNDSGNKIRIPYNSRQFFSNNCDRPYKQPLYDYWRLLTDQKSPFSSFSLVAKKSTTKKNKTKPKMGISIEPDKLSIYIPAHAHPLGSTSSPQISVELTVYYYCYYIFVQPFYFRGFLKFAAVIQGSVLLALRAVCVPTMKIIPFVLH